MGVFWAIMDFNIWARYIILTMSRGKETTTRDIQKVGVFCTNLDRW